MAVKLLGICGSYRKASTYTALTYALEEAEKQGNIEVTILELAKKNIHPCIGCNRCIKEGVNACPTFKGDDMDGMFETFMSADAYLIASPVYSMGMTPILTSLFSRFRPNFLLSRKDPDMNLLKVGAAIAVGGTRNGGQESTITQIHGFYHTKGITVVNGGLGAYSGGCVWSHDGGSEGVISDEENLRNLKAIGRRIAKAATAINSNRP